MTGVARAHLPALLVFVAVARAAAIDGTVLNGTTQKPQPGATVSLFRVGGNGPEMLESVKSDAQGKFVLNQEIQGPRLIQAAFDGVVYNKMLPPGFPSQNVTVNVYQSSAKPGEAHVDQHMMLIEPVNGRMNVSESYVFKNDGKITYNDPDKGTLQFYTPPGSTGLEVNVLAPQSMPIRRAPEKTGQPDVYKLDFPIKPGESRVDMTYSLPFTTPGEFQSKVLFKGGATRVVAPVGVTVSGEGVQSLGQEPRTQATIYSVEGPALDFKVDGNGSLRSSQESAGDDADRPTIQQVMPRLYNSASPAGGFLAAFLGVKWILLLALGVLSLTFALLYRAKTPEPAEAKNERSRR